jgi:hypothetical protein
MIIKLIIKIIMLTWKNTKWNKNLRSRCQELAL